MRISDWSSDVCSSDLLQQLIHAGVSFVASVDEVDDDYAMLLSVSVTATNALFDALRIPGQVVVDDGGAELKVDSFGSRLGFDHDRAAFLEVLNQRCQRVGSFCTGNAVSSFVPLE